MPNPIPPPAPTLDMSAVASPAAGNSAAGAIDDQPPTSGSGRPHHPRHRSSHGHHQGYHDHETTRSLLRVNIPFGMHRPSSPSLQLLTPTSPSGTPGGGRRSVDGGSRSNPPSSVRTRSGLGGTPITPWAAPTTGPSEEEEDEAWRREGERDERIHKEKKKREMESAAAAERNREVDNGLPSGDETNRSSIRKRSHKNEDAEDSDQATGGYYQGSGSIGENDDNDDDDDDDEEDRESVIDTDLELEAITRGKPWWRRPAPIWVFPLGFLMSLCQGIILGASAEVFIRLVCEDVLGIMPDDLSGLAEPSHPTSKYHGINSTTLGFYDSVSGTESGSSLGVERLLGFNRDDQFLPSSSSSKNQVWIAFPEGDDTNQGPPAPGDPEPLPSPPSNQSNASICRHNPAVQRATNALNVTYLLLMGVLSALTVSYWGALSDRGGRKVVLTVAMLGLFISDATFLMAAHWTRVIGYRFMLMGPIIEGLMGGIPTAVATMHAYIADCTPSGSKTRAFSIFQATYFAGFAVGPSIGSIILANSGVLLLPVYLALALHLLQVLWAMIIPASQTQRRRDSARRTFEKRRKSILAQSESVKKRLENATKKKRFILILGSKLRTSLDGVLEPLVLFKPKTMQEYVSMAGPDIWVKSSTGGNEQYGTEEEGENGGSRLRLGTDSLPLLFGGKGMKGRDWNLVKIAVAASFFHLGQAFIQSMPLYTQYKFDWGPEEIGHYLTLLGGCRVVALLIFLPGLDKLFRQKRLPEQTKKFDSDETSGSREENAPLLPDSASTNTESTLSPSERAEHEAETYSRVVYDTRFDTAIGIVSIFADSASFLLLTLASDPTKFIVSTVMQSFAGGANPALNSAAIQMSPPKDIGKLLAALGMISGLFSQVLGPLCYAVIYDISVGSFTEAIFVFAFGIHLLSALVLFILRIPSKRAY